ncbi:hypothetical protein IO89_15090 [Epilithonimonas lactis]|uniref:Uncharacterized protein n=1 Tax=Epilithonimonas lactis TaxID=421072 RepID=A0A085BGA3_9FLAO|nr:hypothetical protein IO89_15090 [Epilithonimonas lactis]
MIIFFYWLVIGIVLFTKIKPRNKYGLVCHQKMCSFLLKNDNESERKREKQIELFIPMVYG